MQSVFRPLAPAPPGGPPEPSGSEPRRRKKKARLACNHCRLKRVGCDGARPDCTRCLRSCVPCVYLSDDADATPTMALKSEVDTLQRQLREHTDFVKAIRNASDDEALAIVHRLRLTEDLHAAISPHQGHMGGQSQLPEHASARAALPPTDTGIGSELVMVQPATYPVLESPSPSSIVSASLLGGSTQHTSSSSTPRSPSDPNAYCDPRLELLIVSYWTRIPIDNALAARTISHFLQTDHPVLGFFDADLFLRDLVGQGLNFCSSFLFHSVMLLACQSYSAVDLRVEPFVTLFIEGAFKLWHAERSSDTTTTLAALNCLSVATGWDGGNGLGNHQLVTDAREMATRMQLLDLAPTAASVDYLRDLDEDETGDQAHVDWGNYGWHSFRASSFQEPPTRCQPNVPISGHRVDVSAKSDAFEPAHQAPRYLGLIFTVLSKFWTIAQECPAVYDIEVGAPLAEKVIPLFAVAKYHKLLTRAYNLSHSLSNNLNSASHLSLLQCRPLRLPFEPL